MKRAVARCHTGAQDLYYGVPDIEGAVVTRVIQGNEDECETTLIFEKNGKEVWHLKVKQG